jgi:heme o synthase
MRTLLNLFKLRIGVAIAVAALAGWAVERGPVLAAWQIAVLALAVLMSSAAAGAFNQYVECDIDARMRRTRNRPFVTGRLRHRPAWLWAIGGLTVGAVLAAALATNLVAAAHVFLGAFFYGVVYTVWLKRRTWLNIVIGGLAGSFAVLAGAAAVSPAPGPVAIALAVVLFLWTPPHFWSLAIAYREDYEAAGVPMLPVVVGDARAANAVLTGAWLLIVATLVPALFGLGPVYVLAAVGGGTWFLLHCHALAAAPSAQAARAAFRASLVQLVAVLGGAMLDVALR